MATEHPDRESLRQASSSYWAKNLGGSAVTPTNWRAADPAPSSSSPGAGMFSMLLILLVLAAGAFVWLRRPSVEPALRVAQADRITLERTSREWVPVSEYQPLVRGAYLRTNTGHTGVLLTRDGGTLRLDAATTVRVSSDDHLLLYVGRAFVAAPLSVDTVLARVKPGPQATYEVAHTRGADGRYYTDVRVFRGTVGVALARGGSSQKVAAGREVRVAPGRLGHVRALPRREPWEIWNLSWTSVEAIPPYHPKAGSGTERLRLPPMQPGSVSSEAGGPSDSAVPGRSYPSGHSGAPGFTGGQSQPFTRPAQDPPRQTSPRRSAPSNPGGASEPAPTRKPGATSYPSAAEVKPHQAPPGY